MDYGVVEIKAFVPSTDYALSKQFYMDLGFEMKSSSEELAYFACGNSSFLLQNFNTKGLAENFVMHLLVESADDWWSRLKNDKIAEKYSVHMGEPEDRPWRMRDFTVTDPSGVVWRIGNNI